MRQCKDGLYYYNCLLYQMTKINNKKTKRNNIQKSVVFDLKQHSIQELFQAAISGYKEHDTHQEDRWNKVMAESGTKKDKISAVGVLLLENPQSSLKYFDMLIKWCFDSNHNFAIQACEALSNVYVDHVFGEKKLLSSFADSVQKHIKEHKKKSSVSKQELIGFYLENQIKQFYNELIKALELLLENELTHIKKSCIKMLGSLARFKQLRRTVLSLIINKLGDTDMEIVNQVSKCLKDQFYQDLAASETLLEETERFLFRANLPSKSQFYVINFLNNINLKYLNERSMAKLFDVFYHFFSKNISNQSGEEQLASRLFLNSIKGLNKIFSFIKGGSKETKKNIEDKVEQVYKVVHTVPNLKARVQLLLFLFQSQTYLYDGLSNRFYRVLYDFIGNDAILHCSLAEMVFDLLLVSIKQDENINRILAFCKRVLQLCFRAQSNFIITSLLMIDRIVQSKQGVKAFLQKPQNFMIEDANNVEKYDMQKRDPQFCHADQTCLWQLTAFVSHFHPTVRKFARSLISGNPIEYQGNNPLLQFNLTSFVQKMSLRKQKKSEAWRIKVKRNLPKMRSSKYETLLNKQLDNFQEDEEYIKKYLEKRNAIHVNRKKQTTDIDQFADEVIMKEMDRLNPDDDMSDLSISQEEVGSDFENQGSAGIEDQQISSENHQLIDGEEDEEDGEDLEDGEEDGEDGEDMDEDEEDEQNIEQSKQFEDVFEQIEESDSFPAKNKKISKPFHRFSKNGKNGKGGKGGKVKKGSVNGKLKRGNFQKKGNRK